VSARPSRAGAAFGRLAAASPAATGETPRHPDAATPERPDTEVSGRRDAETPRPRPEPVSRFTVRLWSEDEADRWELLRMRLRRETGRGVDKAEMVRALVDLAVADDAVRAALVRALRSRGEG
jgi:hypothetical protein